MKIIIFCVDRDDDLGSKATVSGPVIGKKDVLNAAVKLLLKDPSETDANAMFAGLKLYDEIKDDKEIAIITGSQRVGYKSDLELKKQAEKVVKQEKPDGAIIVSDGKEDEMVIPLIESLVPVVSIHRVAVHSGEELKGLYYTFTNFLKRSSENPETAKTFFGIPALIAITYAIFGGQGWRLLSGVLGLILLIKGFRLERPVSRFTEYLKNSFINLSTSFFVYLSSLVLLIIAIVKTTQITGTPTQIISEATVRVGPLYYYSILATLMGLAIDSLPNKTKAYGFLTVGVGFGVLLLVLRGVASWVLDPTYPLSYIVTTTILGAIIVTLTKLSSKFIK